MNAIGRRLQQAGVQPAPEVKDEGQQPQAKPAQQNEPSAAVVRLAVRSGRVQASQGAEVLDLLEASAQDAESLRTQHRKARAIQAMLQDGSVTPDQGRQLMNAIGRRLQQAGRWRNPPRPTKGRPAPGPQPAPQQRRGATRRGTKTPNAGPEQAGGRRHGPPGRASPGGAQARPSSGDPQAGGPAARACSRRPQP